MKKRNPGNRSAFTLIELITAIVITIIALAPVAVAIVNGQRSWQAAYNRIYADVVSDGYYARKRFDSTLRKAGRNNVSIDSDQTGIEARYYFDSDSSFMDCYAYFYESNNELKIEYGQINSISVKQTAHIETVCGNVTGCTFTIIGDSAQMFLTLNDGSKSHTVISSALMHN